MGRSNKEFHATSDSRAGLSGWWGRGAALALATNPALTPVICVAGSLYLIGEILAHRGRAPLDILGSQADVA